MLLCFLLVSLSTPPSNFRGTENFYSLCYLSTGLEEMVWSWVRGGLGWYQENPGPAVCKKTPFFPVLLAHSCWRPSLASPGYSWFCSSLSQAFLQSFLSKSKTHTSHRLKLLHVGPCGLLLHLLQFTSVLLGWGNPNCVHTESMDGLWIYFVPAQ